MRVLILLYVAEDAASLSLLFWIIMVKIYSGYLILTMEDLFKYLLRFCVQVAFVIMPVPVNWLPEKIDPSVLKVLFL